MAEGVVSPQLAGRLRASKNLREYGPVGPRENPSAEGPGLTGMSAEDLFRRTEASIPAEGPMLDGMPAGALFRGYADPTGLDAVSGPAEERGIIEARQLQAIRDAGLRQQEMEARRRQIQAQAQRDLEMTRALTARGAGAVGLTPRGFPSQDPRDQAARYDELLQTTAPLRVPQAIDPIQDAADRAILQRRLDAMVR
jgi:hypothetical protein